MLAMHMKAIGYLVGPFLGLLFGLGAFATARQSPLWARFSYLLVGAVAAGWGILGFLLEYHRSTLAYSTRLYLDHYITLLAGIGIGVFAVLAISGQLKPDRFRSRPRPSDKSSAPRSHDEV